MHAALLATTDVEIDANWVIGLMLAMTRVAAFTTASPLLSKTLPKPGHLALVVSVGFFLARPVTGASTVPGLITATFTNLAVGVVLGMLTGLVFQLFAVAGAMLDLSAGLSIAAIFDPINNQPEAVFGRLFSQVALCIFVMTGGLNLFVIGLHQSVAAVPLDGTIGMEDGILRVVAPLVAQLVIAGLELGMPALAALFVAEVVLGVAARLAPQANVFLIGLPLKLLIAMVTAGVVLLLIPTYVTGVQDSMLRTFTEALRTLT